MLLQTPHMKLAKFCEMTGFTEKAIRRKIEDGVWLEGHEFHRSPTKEISIDVLGYNRWAQGLPRAKRTELEPA